jgi:vacuolar-type H+-ATPase subunit E/Vma4
MSDNQDMPNVEEIKDRLKGEAVKIEDETIRIEEEDLKDAGKNVVDEMGSLGRKFAETLRGAWDSEERSKFENELKAGVRQFADEVDKIIREVRSSNVGAKLQEGTSKVRDEVGSDDLAERAKSSFTKGLRWLSDEMGKLADQFAAKDKDLADDIKIVNDSDEKSA